MILFGLSEDSIQNPGSKLLGSKGAKLVDMCNAGLPVPPGVIVPVPYCTTYRNLNEPGKSLYIQSTAKSVVDLVSQIKKELGYLPLLSVRSGAEISMPGMMDTILNVGLSDQNLEFWKGELGAVTATDCYRRLLQMYGTVVLGLDPEVFEGILSAWKAKAGVKADSELSVTQLDSVVARYVEYMATQSTYVPNDWKEQLQASIKAVWESWDSPRAKTYRKLNGIPDSMGTAVTIQVMVFGNMNDQSCSGVMFTRNPNCGTVEPYGDFCINAQGEDVVAGIRETIPMADFGKWNIQAWSDLCCYSSQLEKEYKDMQDIEFTVQDGNLFILQTRNGKRSSRAAFNVAFDLCKEGIITKEDVLDRLSVRDYISAKTPAILPTFKDAPILEGIPAGGGIISGVAVFSSKAALECSDPCILVRVDTSPDDIEGMNASVGILTKNGGTTSHAAVVGRAMGKACVVGAIDMVVTKHSFTINDNFDLIVKEGDLISIDGDSGKVWVGKVPVTPAVLPKEIEGFINSLFEGVNLLSLGMSKDDAVNGKVFIPYSMYGINRETNWAEAIKEAIHSGLKVYTSFNLELSEADTRILSFFGKSGIIIPTSSELSILLANYGLSGKYHLWGSNNITLENFVSGGVNTVLTEEQILKVFGTSKAYDLIVELMGDKLPPVEEAVIVESIVTYLKKVFKKGA